MSIILTIAVIFYCVVAVIFNLAMLSCYRQEKDSVDFGWSGNPLADKIGMVVASAGWPVCLVYGFYKMYIKKEGN